jgi:hypothetical protein
MAESRPTRSMRATRIFAYLAGCLAFALSLLVYMDYIYHLGFPDGFITELGRAERQLAYIFIGVSVILGSCFIYLGWVASRKRVCKKLSAAIVLYLVSIISLSLMDYYYRLHLMDSAGG